MKAVDVLGFKDSRRYRERLSEATKGSEEKEALVAGRGSVHGAPFTAVAFGKLDDVSKRMGWLQRGNDSLGSTTKLECFERFFIGYGDIFNSPLIVKPCMLWPNPRIVKTSRD